MPDVSPAEIVRMFRLPMNGFRPTRDIVKNVSSKSLILALRSKPSARIRDILCYVLGERHDVAAVPVLIRALNDSSPGVRSTAADALGMIRSPKAGPALERSFRRERSPAHRAMLAASLGAVGHVHAIPLLIPSLKDASLALRSCAAWSLGHLKARSAEAALAEAIEREPSKYHRAQMRKALRQIRGTNRARRS